MYCILMDWEGAVSALGAEREVTGENYCTTLNYRLFISLTCFLPLLQAFSVTRLFFFFLFNLIKIVGA